MNTSMVKLNLGCGTVMKNGYINIDLYRETADVKLDITKDLPYRDVEEIFASHVVEHLTRREFKTSIKNWATCLKSGGILHIICPEIKRNCEALLSGDIDLNEFRLYVFGGQEDYGDGEYHKNCFTLESIMNELGGFKIIKSENSKGIIEIIAEKI